MKKIGAILLSMFLILSLNACSSSENKNENKNADIGLEEMMNKITDGLDLPASDTIPIKKDKEEFEYYTFTKMKDGLDAIASESQISSQAHSLVLIKTNGNDSEEIAKDIAKNANIAKWVCVRADVGKVLYTDDYIFIIMTNKDAFDGLFSNFENLFGKDNVKTLDIESSKDAQ